MHRRFNVMLLQPRVIAAIVVALALAGTHVWSYRKGLGEGKAAFDAAVAEQTERALALERQVRAQEQQLVQQRQKAEVKYVQTQRAAAAAATRTAGELDRLRHAIAASDARAAAANAAPAAGAHDASRSELFRECATTLAGLAKSADAEVARLIGLQAYVKNVCAAGEVSR